jgi:hypothetical protein
MWIKMLAVGALGFCLLAAPAYAQDAPSIDAGSGAAPGQKGGGKHGGGGKQQTQEQRSAPRADENAAHAVIESLPDQKFDPWRNVR